MSKDKNILNFHIYRYHLLPISQDSVQTSLFPKQTFTQKEIIERKNEFFKISLVNISENKKIRTPMIIHWQDEDYFVLKVANKKVTTIYKDFKPSDHPTEPFVYVLINNDPKVQKIGISENIQAFSNPMVVKNVLSKVFNKELEDLGLSITIKNLFDKQDFWKIIENNSNKITYIDFQFVRPNLAKISKSLNEVFRNFSKDLNSHESHLSVKSPTNGVLENLDKDNDTLKGLTEYSSNGGGNVKIKVKGIRKLINTNEKPVTVEVDEVNIEGVADQILPVIKSIIGDGNN
ncbi:hypothetical protein [Brumimicrobium sp.]|uniref:hypothetical protein n=1 Tax=Brumimicrobium sp. TaxID=2029867 RepID=UPI003A954F36